MRITMSETGLDLLQIRDAGATGYAGFPIRDDRVV
jgi:hypothetical protein